MNDLYNKLKISYIYQNERGLGLKPLFSCFNLYKYSENLLIGILDFDCKLLGKE
jgi:hypothetical protein